MIHYSKITCRPSADSAPLLQVTMDHLVVLHARPLPKLQVIEERIAPLVSLSIRGHRRVQEDPRPHAGRVVHGPRPAVLKLLRCPYFVLTTFNNGHRSPVGRNSVSAGQVSSSHPLAVADPCCDGSTLDGSSQTRSEQRLLGT